MGQALYRKYRSTSLSEIVGQEHITTALKHALENGRISHAYLFTGPRGTGKTSIARILAHDINGLEYGTPQLDIIEIDAASNRRIDEIRDLREKVYVAPTSAKYKVYIIDEVHMLTREAFNALLKTLEEPPAHVVFILATTDAHKLPETIISRTQRYNFKPYPVPQVVKHLRYIAEQEKIIIDDDALELLARHGEGSFRDSISMLDQIGNSAERVTAAMVEQQLGLPPADAIASVAEQLLQADEMVIISLQNLYDHGYRPEEIAVQLGRKLRERLLTSANMAIGTEKTVGLLKQLLEVPAAHDPGRLLELLMFEAVLPPQPAATQLPVSKSSPAIVSATPPPPASHAETPKAEPIKKMVSAVAAAPKKSTKVTKAGNSLTSEQWGQVLAELKKKYNTIYGIVRMAQLESADGVIDLTFSFAFHQKRISDPKNRQILADTLEQVVGQHFQIHCHVSKEGSVKPSVVVPAGDPLKDVSSIFGGGELL